MGSGLRAGAVNSSFRVSARAGSPLPPSTHGVGTSHRLTRNGLGVDSLAALVVPDTVRQTIIIRPTTPKSSKQ